MCHRKNNPNHQASRLVQPTSGEAANYQQLPQLAETDTHIPAAPNVPARSAIGNPDREKRGSKMDLAGKRSGHWLCHRHSGVRDNFDIEKWALSDQMVHYSYHQAVCCHLLRFQLWQSIASAPSTVQCNQNSLSLFSQLYDQDEAVSSQKFHNRMNVCEALE